ncbi:MAG: chemotaxis protein CheX [Candidatus Omnitrophica bacterium]|nr:chemotaxis protein CheX [Candidatus Omnitrophota bacterium]
MAQLFDNQVLNTTIMGVVDETFKQMCHVNFSAEPVVTERDIIEYEGRMRVFPMEKFNCPAYVGIVNYYLSQTDMKDKMAVGMFSLFVKEDMLEKFFRAFDRPMSEAEDEAVCLDVIGEMTNILAGNVKNQLRELEYADLFISAPFKYKNVVPEGAQFDYSLFKKQEIIFTLWKEKCVAVEACMGYVAQRKKK